VMNYLFTAPAIAFSAGRRVVKETVIGRGYDPWPGIDAPTYAAKIDRLLGLYPWPITLTQLNLLDSHDTSRFLTIAGGDTTSVKLGTLLMFTFPGAPCIYYGDEIGLTGALPDHWCRKSFPWDHPDRWDQDLLRFHRAIVALRRAHPALRVGAYRRLFADGAAYVFVRTLGDRAIVVGVNAGDEPHTVAVPFERAADAAPPERLFAVGERSHAETAAGTLSIAFPARSGVVLDASRRKDN
jgi:cyclomaltodextrinase